ncbi:MAG: hypothetical protein ACOYLQ_00440 [Hyphomicrobiaceae bacterium]
MKLNAIRVAGVGPFRDGVAIERLSGGLDLLVAPNETGKTTLFRALSVLFREAHTANNPRTRALQPAGGGSPLVEVDFEVGGRPWRLTKRWFGQRLAILDDVAAGRTLRGADAEAAAHELLAGDLDRSAMAGLLWVDQTKSFDLPVADQKAGQALTRLIEGEIAGAVGAGRARQVRATVRARLDGLITAKSKRPKTGTEYAKAEDDIARLRARLDEARQQERTAIERLEALARLAAEEVELADPARNEARRRQMTDDTAAIAAAVEAASTLEKARLAREAAEARFQQARDAAADFDALLVSLADIDRRTAEARDTHTRLLGERQATEAAVVAAREETRSAAAAVDAARLALAGAETRRRRQDWRREHAARAARLAAARAASEALALAEAAARPVDERGLRLVKELAGEKDRLLAELSAAAPRITFDLLPAGEGKVRIEGRPVAAAEVLTASHAVEIEIAGIGRVRVAPGGDASLEERRRRLSGVEQELAGGLAAIGAASVAQAEAQSETAREAAASAREARARLQANAPRGLDVLARELAELTAQLAGTDDPLEDVVVEIDPLVGALQHAEAHMSRAAVAERTAESNLAVHDQRLAVLEATLGRDAAERATIERALPPPDDRAGRAAELAGRHTAARLTFEEALLFERALRERVPDAETVTRMRAALAEAQASAAAAAARLETVRREAAGLQGALARDGETGSSAAAGDIEVELAAAAARVARFEQEAKALLLVERVLAEVEQEDRASLARPLVTRLATYAGRLLPGTDIVLGEGFAVSAVHRASAPQPPDLLSTGTIEQIGLLTRLAYARLLADQGMPVPVVLDDPLVYADDRRLKDVFAILAEAAEHHQVVVLSCHEAAFRPLGEQAGARILALEAWQPPV